MKFKIQKEPNHFQLNYIKSVLFRQLSQYYMDHKPLSFTSFFIRPAVDLLITENIHIIIDEEYPTLILGFVITSKAHDNTLHYVYIKDTYRKEGLAKEAIASVLDTKRPITVTLLSSMGKELMEKYNMIYDNSKLKVLTGDR